MDRRGFLGAMLAAGIAPALVRAESLMPVWRRHAPVLSGESWVQTRVQWDMMAGGHADSPRNTLYLFDWNTGVWSQPREISDEVRDIEWAPGQSVAYTPMVVVLKGNNHAAHQVSIEESSQQKHRR